MLSLVGPAPAGADEVRVAAAASLTHALPEIAAAFERRTGHRLRVSFGASGNLARQIQRGAPFEVFLSASAVHAGLVAPAGESRVRVFALGRLVAWFRGRDAPGDLAGFGAAVRDGRIRRLAIANPEHAPYGIAARDVVDRLGIGEDLAGALVRGENVAQAAQFAATGAVDAALIALSLIRSGRFDAGGSYFVIPSGQHAPIRQTLVLLGTAGEAAGAFARFMVGEEAGRILTQHGFEIPTGQE